MQALLQALSARLRNLEGPDAITAAGTQLLGTHLRANRVTCCTVNERGEGATVWWSWTDGSVPELKGSCGISDSCGGAGYRAGQIHRVEDSEAWPEGTALREEFRQSGIRASVRVPLFKLGQLAAILGVSCAMPRRWTEAEVHLIREASERIWLEVERARAEAALRESALKDAFLSRLSHELATPLAAMRLWIEFLKSDPGRLNGALEALSQAEQAQSRLVRDLLDMSRAVKGTFGLMRDVCELMEPVSAAVKLMGPTSQQKGLHVEVIQEDPPLVNADSKRLQQAISHLLSNAVKFTGPGGHITVRLEGAAQGALLSIQDTGQGFAPDFQPHLFAPFRQEEEGPSRTQGGLGLGLSLVRRIVELHGGWVSGESPGVGRGAVFRLWMPAYAFDEDAPPEPPAQAGQGPGLADVGILVVEDELLTRQGLKAVLESQGARVEAVSSAAAALEALRGRVFDVLLCDIAMPGEDGYSLIHRIRAMPGPSARIRAAAYTAHMREEDKLRVLAAGFQLYIPKSVEPSRLSQLLSGLAAAAAR
ncbi:hybrid sensor histidine kinase/response regulator [Stigmatella hybrida]|uniref:hybrid sensor histidine kinase/response regulator n=1 Tax=Stigmatella hybrida TaxID=394097 RepID=UPI001CDA9269|nr:ATP-binding protein [Stigmatella hybrida]